MLPSLIDCKTTPIPLKRGKNILKIEDLKKVTDYFYLNEVCRTLLTTAEKVFFSSVCSTLNKLDHTLNTPKLSFRKSERIEIMQSIISKHEKHEKI